MSRLLILGATGSLGRHVLRQAVGRRVDALPVEIPAVARALPDPQFVPVFASLVPEMIVPYADAAALMLAHLDRGNAMSRHRVGLALPVGMGGRKAH